MSLADEQMEDDEALHSCADPLCPITPRVLAREDPRGTVKALLRAARPWTSIKLRAVGQIVRAHGESALTAQLVSPTDPLEATDYMDELIEAGLLRLYSKVLARAPSPKLQTAGAVFEGVAALVEHLALDGQDDTGMRRMEEPELFVELDKLIPMLLRTVHAEIGTIARGRETELTDHERDNLARILNFIVCPPFGKEAPASWRATVAFKQITELAAALYATIRMPSSRAALAGLIANLRRRAKEVRSPSSCPALTMQVGFNAQTWTMVRNATPSLALPALRSLGLHFALALNHVQPSTCSLDQLGTAMRLVETVLETGGADRKTAGLLQSEGVVEHLARSATVLTQAHADPDMDLSGTACALQSLPFELVARILDAVKGDRRADDIALSVIEGGMIECACAVGPHLLDRIETDPQCPTYGCAMNVDGATTTIRNLRLVMQDASPYVRRACSERLATVLVPAIALLSDARAILPPIQYSALSQAVTAWRELAQALELPMPEAKRCAWRACRQPISTSLMVCACKIAYCALSRGDRGR